MCGIVTYFGGAGNNLTRVLTGMSAILYRAPDSTGIAVFGDDTESIRLRKSVGAMTRLLEKLTSDGLYPCPEKHLSSSLLSDDGTEDIRDGQRRLLVFEGLPPEYIDGIQAGDLTHLKFDDLVDLDPARQKRLCPGWPGAPMPNLEFAIRSKKDFVSLIQHLISKFDLSPSAIQFIIRNALQRIIDSHAAQNMLEVRADDILSTFDEIYEKILTGERISPPRRLDYGFPTKSLYPHRYVWRYLIQSTIRIPVDYDRDGVRCLFRLLDAALLSRLPHNPLLSERLQQILDAFWPESRRTAPVTWRSLYAVEKGLNLYGWAAATALAYLQREELLPVYLDPNIGRDPMNAEAVVAGRTDPVSLRYFSLPILAHGRWAIQSAVTEKNAHPFTDALRQRAIVLNGQFDSEVEVQVREFLRNVAGVSFRSENSSEYLALLWGYYAQLLEREQQHGDGIHNQVVSGLEHCAIGTQAMDYGVYRQVQGKSRDQIDQMALIEAATRLSRNGGQMAAAAISLCSPRKMYVVSHNRPVFIVQRLDNDDFMVVSDINAAMGLFPQELVQEKVRGLQKQRDTYKADLHKLQSQGASTDQIEAVKSRQRKAKTALLNAFKVAVYPLEGERMFAVIESVLTESGIGRRLTLSDFDGRPLTGIESFVTFLNPVKFRKDFQRSFYETHLAEVPERLNDILRFYRTDTETLLDFGIHAKKLRRRFGRHFGGMKRVILMGTGSAYNMARIAKALLRSLLPEIDMLVLRPGEIQDLGETVVPEKDLVLMLSWSSTTADMVRTAKQLLALNTVMVGITGKTFGDMALITYKSGGVLPILSGEEVTVSSIKSSICMLFCIDLFWVWLAAVKGRQIEADRELTQLQSIPQAVETIVADKDLKARCKNLARRYRHCRAAIVVDAQQGNDVGPEIALKMEENSWSAIGKTIDYTEAPMLIDKPLPAGTLIIVNATCKRRLDEAVEIMEKLHQRGIEFVAVSIAHRQQGLLDRYSRGRSVVLQRLPEFLQPFADLTFYYQFAFYFGLAQGREIGVPPRNRAKSLTISRSLETNHQSTTDRLQVLKEANQAGAEAEELIAKAAKPSQWESHTTDDDEGRYYKRMRRLAEVLATPSRSFGRLADLDGQVVQAFADAVFSDASDVDEIVLIPLDRIAEAAARSIADQWRLLIGYPFFVMNRWEAAVHIPEGAFVIVAAGSAPSSQFVEELPAAIGVPFVWVGPEPDGGIPEGMDKCIGRFRMAPESGLHRFDLLFSQLNEVLIRVWQLVASDKAAVVERHVQMSAQAILAVLDDAALLENIRGSMKINAGYQTAFFIGPPNGTGLAWVECFDRFSPVIMEHHPYGHSAHGPLVTVDPRVEQKFVKLENRGQMITRYGRTQVIEWEHTYLGESSVDAFLTDHANSIPQDWRRPFWAEESVYLPVLQPGYQTVEDNLIIMDTTSKLYFPQGIDEMATFGCRYPRMITLSQATFIKALQDADIFRFPVSSLLLLPGLRLEDEQMSLSEFHLPYCLNLVAMAMACATRRLSETQS